MMFRHYDQGNIFFFKDNLRNFTSLRNPSLGVQDYGSVYKVDFHVTNGNVKTLAPTSLCYWSSLDEKLF